MSQGETLPLLIGNRYILREALGTGSMGTVYRAFDRLNDQMIALKRVTVFGAADAAHLWPKGQNGQPSSTATRDTELRAALAREFQMLASLRHPNIIEVLDYGFDVERQPYFTMTLLDNPRTLVDAGRGRPLLAQVNLLVQTLQALAYLHRRRILHRDLKPGNMLVDSAGQARLLDLGLAAMRDRVSGGQISGTLAYIAPEVLQGAVPTESADLYAVGVMAYEMFAGHHPYDTSNLNHLMADILQTVPDVSKLPVPPALGTVVSRLLAKTPAIRFRDASEVILALSRAVDYPLAVESADIRESFLQAAQFIGREHEWAQLTAALDEAQAGRGSAWLVGGESGVGKTRLLDELRTCALVRGALVLRSQAVAEGSLPYHVWRAPVRRLALAGTLSDFEAGILKEIVPDIAVLIGHDVPDVPPLAGEPGRKRLILTIAALFEREAHVQPVVLILEDLHWADEALTVIRHLCQVVADLPLLLVGSYRDDERPDLPLLLPEMKLLKMARLTESDVAALSASMLGEAGQLPQVIDLLTRETEGNAFFLVETVRVLAEEAGGLEAVGQATLPGHVFSGGVQKVVQRRLERVPGWAYAWLKLAAVAGRALDLGVLEHLIGDDLDRWLTTCANMAVLEVREGRWQFVHDKLREAILENLDDDERAPLHRRIAEALESVRANEVEKQAATLAVHWQIAGEHAKALRYVLIAGDQALALGSYRHAAAHFERALALLPGADQIGQARLFIRLGTVCERMSEHAKAHDHLSAALALAHATGNRELVAEALSGLSAAAYQRGDLLGARRYAEEAHEVARQAGDRSGEALALRRLGQVGLSQGDYAAAAAAMRHSLTIYQSIGDRSGIAAALGNLGAIAGRLGDHVDAIRYYEQSLALYREIGDRRTVADILNNLGVVAASQGDYAAAMRYLEESLALHRETGNPHSMAVALSNLGYTARLKGDYAAAMQRLQESLTYSKAVGNRSSIAICLVNLGHAAVATGDYAQARRYLHDALNEAMAIGALPTALDALVGAARLCLTVGDYTRAAHLVGLALGHPTSNVNVRRTAEALLPELREGLTHDALETALTFGRTLDMRATAEHVLADLSQRASREPL